MKTNIVLVTPEVAKELLKKNSKNRPVSKKTVDFYAQLMSAGKWCENGDTIRIGKSGTLLDGQHRLLAIIKSGKSYHYIIATDVDDIVFPNIDVGRLRRGSDVLALIGVANYNEAASAVRMCLSLQKGLIGVSTCGDMFFKPTNQKILEEYQENQLVYDEACKVAHKCYSKLNFLNKKEIGGIYAFLVQYRQHSSDKVKAFFQELFYGENGNKVLSLLRDRLIKDRISKSHMIYSYKMGLIAKAWNLWLADRETRILKFDEKVDGKLKFN